jgi:hypothetical protein
VTVSLTLFTTCKPFAGRLAISQRNALRSWKKLCPPCEVLVFGDESGVDECCGELGFKHSPEVARNDFGTPLLNGMFEKAARLAKHELLGYVNADIMLTRDVLSAAQTVSERFDKFLLIARRWNADVDEEWDDQIADWDAELRRFAAVHGTLEPPDGGTDVFIYRRGTLDNLPPFAIGRSRCDSLLILEARRRGVPVIDATDVLTLLHQNHDYAHVAGTSKDLLKGPESIINGKLLGGEEFVFTSLNATHLLTTSGLQQNKNIER